MLTCELKLTYSVFYVTPEDKFHRIGMPSRTGWYSSGQKNYQQYRQNDQLHRVGGPAHIEWYFNGQKWVEAHWLNGVNQNHVVF